MRNENKFLITGLVCLLLFASIMAFNTLDKANEAASHNNLNLDKSILGNIESNAAELKTENNTGCTSVIIHVQQGHDIIAYRRDAGYSADMIIEKMNFNGQSAIHQYKTQNGYFTHVIITENGWIISIGGKDNPDINKQLERLGSNIISKGKIENYDIENANVILKEDGWGHFVIKSPDNDVGVAIYDSRISSNITESSSMTALFKMGEGTYVKVPNTPKYYSYGQFDSFSNDPTDAAIKIAGTDPYNNHGIDRRDIITYDVINSNNSKIVNIWASFDGGALLNGAKGSPDNINFFGTEIFGDGLPKIPDRTFLGEETLQNDNLFLIMYIFMIMGTMGFLVVKLAEESIKQYKKAQIINMK